MSQCDIKQAAIDEILRTIKENPLLEMSVRDSLSNATEVDATLRDIVKSGMIEKRIKPTIDINPDTGMVQILAYVDPVNIEKPLSKFSIQTLTDILEQLNRDKQLMQKK